jgi:D-sedoheptulose 7-phosphate isomerase
LTGQGEPADHWHSQNDMSGAIQISGGPASQQMNGAGERWDSFQAFPDLVVYYCRRLSENLGTLADDGAVEAAAQLVWSTLSAGNNIFVAGNGGSAANGTHFATDISLVLSGGCNGYSRCCGSIHPLAESAPTLSAIANDFGFDNSFSRQLAALGHPGDLLIVISVSGRSRNIAKACELAREKQMKIIGLFGDGGALESQTTVSVTVADKNYGRVEDMHLSVLHIITSFIRQEYQRKHRDLCREDLPEENEAAKTPPK